MDPTYSPEAEAYRTKVQTFLASHLPQDWKGLGALPSEEAWKFAAQWRSTLHENGLLAASWPKKYGGGGLSALEQVILAEEFYRAGVPTGTTNDGFGIQMVGNTILHWGTEEQKDHFLPRILSYEDIWCQGYSEPNAGSDLANVATRAELDGDEWIINGQKIWTSAGTCANRIFVLARTEPDAPKHKGISFLLVPMDQPGVEVRPIKMMTGDSEFNEVFFTNARCPKANVVGGVNNGWTVAMTLLGYERGEAAATLPIMFRIELDRLVALAEATGRAEDPLIRQRLAGASRRLRSCASSACDSHRVPGGRTPRSRRVDLQVVLERVPQGRDRVGRRYPRGPTRWSPSGRWPIQLIRHRRARRAQRQRLVGRHVLRARAGTIYAGTSQVQRNILGEMVLGLPKEPGSPRGTWRELQLQKN